GICRCICGRRICRCICGR
nr:Chain A, retrocyclin 2 [synthetic construct]